MTREEAISAALNVLSAAESATKGPWSALIDNYERGTMFVASWDGGAIVEVANDMDPADAAYVALLSPESVRAILESLVGASAGKIERVQAKRGKP